MKTPLQLSYPNAICPDCEQPIPASATDGESCENCGHVFWLNESEVNRQYMAEMEEDIQRRDEKHDLYGGRTNIAN